MVFEEFLTAPSVTLRTAQVDVREKRLERTLREADRARAVRRVLEEDLERFRVMAREVRRRERGEAFVFACFCSCCF